MRTVGVFTLGDSFDTVFPLNKTERRCRILCVSPTPIPAARGVGERVSVTLNCKVDTTLTVTLQRVLDKYFCPRLKRTVSPSYSVPSYAKL